MPQIRGVVGVAIEFRLDPVFLELFDRNCFSAMNARATLKPMLYNRGHNMGCILPWGGRGGGGGGVPYMYIRPWGEQTQAAGQIKRAACSRRDSSATRWRTTSHLFASTVSLSSNIMSKAFWMQACNASLSRSALELQQANSSSNGVAVSGAFRSLLCCARVFTASRGPLTRALRSRCSHLLA